MGKLYERVNWEDKPSTKTPTSAANFNKMDKGIDDLDNKLVEQETKTESLASQVEQIANNQIPEEYLKASVDAYIDEKGAGLATDEELVAIDTKINEVNSTLSSEIVNLDESLIKGFQGLFTGVNTMIVGSIGSDGTANTDTAYLHTPNTKVKKGDVIYISNTASWLTNIGALYKNGEFVKLITTSECTLTQGKYVYSIVDDVNEISVVFYATSNYKYAYINAVEPSLSINLRKNVIPQNEENLFIKNGKVWDKGNNDSFGIGYVSTDGLPNNDTAYMHTSRIKVNIGDTVYIPYAFDGLNQSVGAYFKGNDFVGLIDGSEYINLSYDGDKSYYIIPLSKDLDYDTIVCNMLFSDNGKIFVNDFTENYYYVRHKVKNPTISQWYGKNILVIGDSHTDFGVWYKQLEDLLGANVTARGMSGCGMKDFVDGGTDSHGVTWEALQPTELESIDLVIFWGGYNNRNFPLGEVGDAPVGGTIAGLTAYLPERIYNMCKEVGNTKCQIVWVTPHCVGAYPNISQNGYEEYPSGSGHNLKDFCDLMEKQSEYYSIPCLNLWNKSGINKYTWEWYSRSENDYLHLSDKGYLHVGRIIAEFICNI